MELKLTNGTFGIENGVGAFIKAAPLGLLNFV